MSETSLTSEQKYAKDGPFAEPLVRCDSCQRLLFVQELREHGMCAHCGHTRVRNVRAMSDEDMAQAKEWVSHGKLDSQWVELFEATQ